MFLTIYLSQLYFILYTHETKYSRMDQVKVFKAFLPQILLDPFLNTLSHIFYEIYFFCWVLQDEDTSIYLVSQKYDGAAIVKNVY